MWKLDTGRSSERRMLSFRRQLKASKSYIQSNASAIMSMHNKYTKQSKQ